MRNYDKMMYISIKNSGKIFNLCIKLKIKIFIMNKYYFFYFDYRIVIYKLLIFIFLIGDTLRP